MHDVFIVISEGADGEHIARTVVRRRAKTTRVKHTRKTTPTSPSSRFTNETTLRKIDDVHAIPRTWVADLRRAELMARYQTDQWQ